MSDKNEPYITDVQLPPQSPVQQTPPPQQYASQTYQNPNPQQQYSRPPYQQVSFYQAPPPNIQKKGSSGWKVLLVAVLIALGILIIGGALLNNQNSSNEKFVVTNTQPATEQPEDVNVHVGEGIALSNVKIAFVSCDTNWTGYNIYARPKSGFKIVRAVFEFENTSSTDIVFNSLTCYADNFACDKYIFAEDANDPILQRISAGRKFNGIVYFEVPENAKVIDFQYSTSLFSSDYIHFVVE